MDRKRNQIRRRKFSWKKWTGLMFLFFIACIVSGTIIRKWQDPIDRKPTNTKDHQWSAGSYGFAPHPDDYKDAVIQIYAARVWGAKEAFAVHTWVSVKRKGDKMYETIQVLGWRVNYMGKALYRERAIPDKGWYGNPPTLLLDLRGNEAEGLITRIDEAVKNYPWADEYSVWPGPNSNTFVAWLGLQIPELRVDLPSTAIGKDWRPIEDTFGFSPSGTGIQTSFFGLLGATIGYEEGLEVNVLGLSTELDLFDLAIELPGIGRVGANPVQKR